jgi:Cu/Ag efflux protein CusF
MLKAIAFVLLAMLPAGTAAQTVTKQNQMTATATITAIDAASRNVTLRADNGEEQTFTVGPAVKRFNELKVGDTIRATYYESMVLQLRKPGAAASPSGSVSVAERLKDAPGGVIGTLETTTVTVKSVDMNAPSITVVTAAGLLMTRKVEERKNLEGVAPGDRIEISYSKGVIVAADPSRK